jgi:hypothetical protein
MSDADLEAKFKGLAEEVLPSAQVEETINLCWNISAQVDAGVLARAAVPRIQQSR